MPVRSLNSSVFKWPDRHEVDAAAREWAQRLARERQDVLRVGYIGSYARGDWGVGSDLDLVVILERCDEPYLTRTLEQDTGGIPVPVDVLPYTTGEWQELAAQGRRFYRTVESEAVWVYERGQDS